METTLAEEHVESHEPKTFLGRYVFARDHKIIGLQFIFSTLIWMSVGGLLALGIRWQLAWPWSNMPIFGDWFFAAEGGQITPEFYNVLFTMHATIMIFFVVIPILAGGFGNYLIPLMIGARDMAFPTLNMLSYWLLWPSFFCMFASLWTVGVGPSAGWTAYPPLSVLFGEGIGWWVLGLIFSGVASMLGAINYITTIIQMRAPGMTFMRMPMTIWGLFITSILQAFALPVLTAALFLLLSDRVAGTSFYLAEGLDLGESVRIEGGGEALLWQHLFWFYSHPAVYIMILPAMGMISDILSCFSRKPLFGYRPMVFSMMSIAGMGFIVWGHHMFVSGMNYYLSVTFLISTILIALPSGVKVFNWLATIWAGRLQLTASMLFALGFVSMFVIGGLSGVVMATPAVDIMVHDTYYIVAHFHYVLFGSSIFGVFAAIYFWFPKMFGRMMNESLGKIHFLISFVAVNLTFFPMHFLGARGFPRRYADPYQIEIFRDLLPINQLITYAAIAMAIGQVFFILNFLWSIRFGRRAETNPWRANSLEWATASPPPHGNFEFQPRIIRGPYDYGNPANELDYSPQYEMATLKKQDS
ncbi:MAG: cbb3-type cytochrome c oxidase subunit I [Pirellulaceae bacterium]